MLAQWDEAVSYFWVHPMQLRREKKWSMGHEFKINVTEILFN